jgi:gamma-glutamyltranspeptidase/glutathione hydrolase
MLATLVLGAAPARGIVTSSRGLVISYHPLATQAGERILQGGGNAFDAFVAATMVEYVIAEGGTSLAGPLGALVYDARKNNSLYLDADVNDVKDPDGAWTAADPKPGKAVVVPGALAGLEALSKRYGRLSFATVLEPAINLARQGFEVGEFYASLIAWRADVLRSSEYGRRTFFPGGRALKAGDTLRQPDLADFLTKVSREGSAYMYRGAWAIRCVDEVRAQGGLMAEADLAEYRPAWVEPWHTSYRGYDLYASSARNYGGLWVLLALKTLENTDLARLGHYSASADGLEIVVRTVREVWAEQWLFDARKLEDRRFVEARLTPTYALRVWNRVKSRLSTPPREPSRLHSYHIIVLDQDGNAVTGTHTIQSLPWGTGIFVEGIPLSPGGMVPFGVGPGERRLNGLTMHLAFRNGKLRYATGAVTGSLVEANLQLLLNLIDYRLPAERAVSMPRFGTFPHNLEGTRWDWSSNWLDPRVSSRIVERLRARGLFFEQKGPLVGTGLDTGLGAVAAIKPDGRLEGATIPWPGLTYRR